MGDYFDDNIDKVVPEGEKTAISEALDGSDAWWHLAHADEENLAVTPWQKITAAPSSGAGYDLDHYKTYFKQTVNNNLPRIPSLEMAQNLQAKGWNEAVSYQQEQEEIVAKLAAERRINESDDVRGTHPGFKEHVQKINEVTAYFVGIPHPGILPSAKVDPSTRRVGEYDIWHDDNPMEDMKDVLLYLYLTNNFARKDNLAQTAEALSKVDIDSLASTEGLSDTEALQLHLTQEARRRQNEAPGQPLPDSILTGLENIASKDISYFQELLRESAQCILRLNLASYVEAHQALDFGLKRPHDSIWLADGDSATLINKLTYDPDSKGFLRIRTHEISQVTPMIRLFKSYYDKDGTIDKEVEISFDGGTLGSRTGVGIKSFDWKLNATNPSLVRNDIEATLVLYFQNFNDLIKRRSGVDVITAEPLEEGYAYQDLLLRPPVEGTTVAPISSQNQDPQEGCQKNNNTLYNSQFYEIKAQVGWAPTSKLTNPTTPGVLESINNQQLPLFLTLIDHEFSFTQEGTFELSITYRARLEALINDPRMDVLSTADTKVKVNKMLERIQELGKTCGTGKLVGSLNESIAKEQEKDRDNLAESLIKTLEPNIYFSRINKDDFFAFTADPSASGRGVEFGGVHGLRVSEKQVIQSMVVTLNSRKVAIDSRARLVDTDLKSRAEDAKKEKEPTAFESGFLTDPRDPKIIMIPWFYFGDLVSAAVNHCFPDEAKSGPGLIAAENILFLLGSFPIKVIGGIYATGQYLHANLADVPISLELFNQWYIEKIITPNRFEYPLLEFLRDFISDVVVPSLNKQCYDTPAFRNFWYRSSDAAAETGLERRIGGQWSEVPRLIPKSAAISLPSENSDDLGAKGRNTLGLNPLEKFRIHPSAEVDEYLGGSRLDLATWDPISKKMTRRNNSRDQTLKNSYHASVFYLINEDSYLAFGPPVDPDKTGPLVAPTREDRDFKQGVFHLYPGADRGLVKSVNFSKVNAQYLREARIQQRALNPLAQLAATYNVNLKLIGNTIFWPGQYLFVNPIGYGNGLGQPDDTVGESGFGSPSNQLGLGGYHLITEVNNYVEDGKFETEITALFEFSGDGCPSLPGATPLDCNSPTAPNNVSGKAKPITTPATSAPVVKVDISGQPPNAFQSTVLSAFEYVPSWLGGKK
jgi:hypothetical protein